MERHKKITAIYKKHKDKFQKGDSGGLYNLLDQIFINNTYKPPVCLYGVWRSEGLMLAIVQPDQDGYYPTTVFFKEGITDEEAREILSDINKEAFGLQSEQWDQMVARSMGMP